MSDPQPLSAITENLQSLAKAKHDDSLMTGREFVEAYSPEPAPHDLTVEPNTSIATAGGDVQHAYSKLNAVYSKAKNANATQKNDFKVSGEAPQELNTEALVGELEIASEKLRSAAEKLDDAVPTVAERLRALSIDVDAHREQIAATGMVRVT